MRHLARDTTLVGKSGRSSCPSRFHDSSLLVPRNQSNSFRTGPSHLKVLLQLRNGILPLPTHRSVIAETHSVPASSIDQPPIDDASYCRACFAIAVGGAESHSGQLLVHRLHLAPLCGLEVSVQMPNEVRR